MRIAVFIGTALLAGVISGLIHGGINLVVTEPFIDQAIDLEIKNAIAQGEDVGSPEEIAQYRTWQKGGQVLAGSILGLSLGSLFALVYAFSWSSLRGSDGVKKGLFLAAIMWFTLFMVPFLKYPANPPAVGNPETIYYRQSIYLVFIAVSGLGALALALLYKTLDNMKRRNIIIPVLYAAYIIAVFIIMPPNPDQIGAPMELVNNFRIASALTTTIFWFVLGAIFGASWDRFKPHVRVTNKL
ncbi:MAG: CbtA family protein [Nitrososphaerales archaeon]